MISALRLGLTLWALVLPGQGRQVTISGHVVRMVAGRSVPVSEGKVILHRVSPRASGMVDSLLSGADGTFSFRVTPDSGDIYIVSSWWGGVEYFGQPYPAKALSGNRSSDIVVSDTSSNAVVEIGIRQLVIVAPAPDGTRDVVDVVTLYNRSTETRISTKGKPWSWQLQLPTGILNPTVDRETDFSVEAFRQLGDSLQLSAPIPPGEHAVYLSYRIPAGMKRFVVPADDGIDSMSIYAGEAKIDLDGEFRLTEKKELEGKSFSHWEGRAPKGKDVVLRLPGDGRVPTWMLPVLVGVMAAGLLGVTAFALRRSDNRME